MALMHLTRRKKKKPNGAARLLGEDSRYYSQCRTMIVQNAYVSVTACRAQYVLAEVSLVKAATHVINAMMRNSLPSINWQ